MLEKTTEQNTVSAKQEITERKLELVSGCGFQMSETFISHSTSVAARYEIATR